jgi:large-conductance mechanosensitive channel
MSADNNTNMTQLDIEKLRLDAASKDKQMSYAFWTATITTIINVIVSPLLLFFLHQQTVSKVEETKAAVQQVDEKSDVSLMQWKAYNTKDYRDEHRAAVGMARMEERKQPETMAAAKEAK